MKLKKMRIDLQPRNVLKQQGKLGRNSRWKCSAICQKKRARRWLDVRFDLEGKKEITDPLLFECLLSTCSEYWVRKNKPNIFHRFGKIELANFVAQRSLSVKEINRMVWSTESFWTSSGSIMNWDLFQRWQCSALSIGKKDKQYWVIYRVMLDI